MLDSLHSTLAESRCQEFRISILLHPSLLFSRSTHHHKHLSSVVQFFLGGLLSFNFPLYSILPVKQISLTEHLIFTTLTHLDGNHIHLILFNHLFRSRLLPSDSPLIYTFITIFSTCNSNRFSPRRRSSH